jgi:hypothetical protein
VAVAVVFLGFVGYLAYLVLQGEVLPFYIFALWPLAIGLGLSVSLRHAAADPAPRREDATPKEVGHRYKGTTPFQDLDLDRRIFFGRDRESRSLLSLVLAERLVVLFAKSGMERHR